MAGCILYLISLLSVVLAIPVEDPVIRKLDPVRYHYIHDADGNLHLVDLWMKVSDLQQAARYDADTENVYHLFTRTNPSVSQPMLYGNVTALEESNFSSEKRTAVLVHGWMNDATSDIFTVLVPAFLAAEDMNVIVVDWSAGAGTIDYVTAVTNTVTSGESVARYLNWVCNTTGVTPDSFHIAGHSLGGQQAGIIGRNLDEQASYITAMDPAYPGWVGNSDVFQEDDGAYTEVIHTNSGLLGYLTPLGHVDFYPNGGVGMPGCILATCDHSRSFFYFAESIESGGFTGTLCDSYVEALVGSCDLTGTLEMGGITPKTGETGVFYLETNSAPPFSIS